MKKSFLVIGMGRFGVNTAIELRKLGNEVMAVDANESKLAEVEGLVSSTVVMDCRDEDNLSALNVEDFNAVVIAIASDVETSILIAVILKELGVKYLLAKAQSDLHAKVLQKVGVDKIIIPEGDMAVRTAHALNNPTFVDVVSFGDNMGLMELKCPASWSDHSLKELNLNKKYRINIVAVKKDTRVVAPLDGDYVLDSDDILLAIGPTDGSNKLS